MIGLKLNIQYQANNGVIIVTPNQNCGLRSAFLSISQAR